MTVPFYSTPVAERFHATRHAGCWEEEGPGILRVESESPAAKFRLVLRARVAGGRVAEARFQAYGCPVTIAVGDFIAEYCRGRAAQELALDAAAIRAALEIPEDRTHCALMGEDVIRALRSRMRST